MISRFIKIIDLVEIHLIGNVSILLFAAGLVVAMNEVIGRYVFHHSFAWSNELVTLMLVFSTLLNYGLAQRNNRHIRVGLFLTLLNKRWVTIAGLFNDLLGMIMCVILIIHGFQLTCEVKKYNYATEVLRIPTCIGYGVFVLAFVLLLTRYILDAVALIRSFSTRSKQKA